MQIVKVKGWEKVDVTSAAIAAYLEQARAADLSWYGILKESTEYA